MTHKHIPEWKDIPQIQNADGTVSLLLPKEFVEHLRREGRIPFQDVTGEDARQNDDLIRLANMENSKVDGP